MKKHDKASKATKSALSKKRATELTEEEAAKVTGGGGFLEIKSQDGASNT